MFYSEYLFCFLYVRVCVSDENEKRLMLICGNGLSVIRVVFSLIQKEEFAC